MNAPAEVQNVTSLGSLMTAAAPPASRVVNIFDLPPGLAKSTGIKTIGMVELETGEELMATQRSGNDMLRLGIELAKESLRFIDDKKLSTGDLSADAFWKTCPSALRQLILTAYGLIHNPPKEDAASFLLSRRQQAR